MTRADHTVADALRAHWADRILPQPLRPYARLMRLERPIGWWLLLLPGWWSIALASHPGLPSAWLFLLFFLGAVLMRGAGCVWNDITDRDFDAAVARTRSRPIPSGQVSVAQALAFLFLLVGVSALILVEFNHFTIRLGIASLALIVTYPFMKRVTFWPQAFLGLTFNWGALMGWAAVKGSLDTPALLLYAGGLFWTLAYDTIYAHQDKDDDMLIGVKSTALKLGEASPRYIAAFFALALLAFAGAGWLNGSGVCFLAGLAAAALHALWQLARLDIRDPANCLRLFRANRGFGLLILAGALADNVWTAFP